MAWIRRYKRKKLISKISVDSNFTFSNHAWLCVFHCSHRLLCLIKSRVRDFLWKWFQPNSFEEVCFLEESYENMEKTNFENFESAFYSTSGSMPLTYWNKLIFHDLHSVYLFCLLCTGVHKSTSCLHFLQIIWNTQSCNAESYNHWILIKYGWNVTFSSDFLINLNNVFLYQKKKKKKRNIYIYIYTHTHTHIWFMLVLYRVYTRPKVVIDFN